MENLNRKAIIYLDRRDQKHLVSALHPPKDFTPDFELRSVLDTPWDAFTPCRLLDQHVHCAFLPTGQDRLLYQEGPLSVLNYTLQTLPIRTREENGRIRYELDQTVSGAWQSLELLVYGLISEAHRVWNTNLPLEYDDRQDFRPSRYKYFQSDANEHKVRRRANLARASFSIQLAKYSYLYALAKMDRRNNADDLFRSSKINPIFLNAVQNSWCLNPQVPRVGAIVDATLPADASCRTQWYKNLELITREFPCLPIWIDYGTDDTLKYPLEFAEANKPPSPIIWLANEKFKQDQQDQIMQEAVRFPDVFEWIADTRVERDNVMLLESNLQREQRELREAAHADHPIPGPRGPKVFLWEYTEHREWLRYQILNHREEFIQQLWSTTTPAMRVYNSIHHEWEVCYELDPTWNSPSSGSSTADAEEFPPFYDNTEQLEIDDAAYLEAVRNLLNDGGRMDVDVQLLMETDLVTILQQRYCLRLVPGYTGSLYLHANGRLSWDKCLKTLRLATNPLPTVALHIQAAASDIVTSLHQNRIPPTMAFDLGPRSLYEYHAFYATSITSQWRSREHMRCGVYAVDHEDVFRIDSSVVDAVQETWLLIAHDAIDVAHAIRIADSTPNFEYRYDVARYFVRNGISFRTLAHATASATYRNDMYLHQFGLGLRPFNYVFSYVDYVAYETERNRLLNGPAGRAALMAGGILWRLAVQVVGEEHVLFGPTHTSQTQVLATLEGMDFVDDVLTPDEIDIICGTYKVMQRELYSTIYKWWY